MAHHVYFPGLAGVSGGAITITGDEAHHAVRVKRLSAGDSIVLCDGRGRIAQTRVRGSEKTREGWAVELQVEAVEEVGRIMPEVVVASATPKGERLEAMIDGLSQVGAGGWRPMMTKRTVVDPREGKLGRLERVAVEAMKQCGRAWLLELGSRVSLVEALQSEGRVVIADASGGEYQPSGSERVTVLIGPEGGWEPGELELARGAGVQVARFGPHVMRTELAGVVGAAVVLGHERRLRGAAV